MASNVVYIGNIPYGFFEPQVKKFFSQFGTVSNVKLCRSRKTAHSKGYGFVQFASADVAQIVASTMNNYLMFDKLLKCELVAPKKDGTSKVFARGGKKFTKSRWPEINAARQNRQKTAEKQASLERKMITRLAAKNAKLAKLGLDYNYPLSASAIATTQKLSVGAAGQKANTGSALSPGDAEPLVSFVVDSSEDEISFRTPPNARRRGSKTSSSTNDVASTSRASSSTESSVSRSVKQSARETRQLSRGKERARVLGGSDTKVIGIRNRSK